MHPEASSWHSEADHPPVVGNTAESHALDEAKDSTTKPQRGTVPTTAHRPEPDNRSLTHFSWPGDQPSRDELLNFLRARHRLFDTQLAILRRHLCGQRRAHYPAGIGPLQGGESAGDILRRRRGHLCGDRPPRVSGGASFRSRRWCRVWPPRRLPSSRAGHRPGPTRLKPSPLGRAGRISSGGHSARAG